MISKIIAMFGGEIAEKLIGALTKPFELYLNKQISAEQLRTQVLQALLSTFAEVEKAYAESIAKTYATFMDAAVKNGWVLFIYVSVALTQLAILIWHQVGVPALTAWMRSYGGAYANWSFPSSGSTVEWSYALLSVCVGAGALALRGSSPNALVDKLKALIGR